MSARPCPVATPVPPGGSEAPHRYDTEEAGEKSNRSKLRKKHGKNNNRGRRMRVRIEGRKKEEEGKRREGNGKEKEQMSRR
jgi:hypothetical protein